MARVALTRTPAAVAQLGRSPLTSVLTRDQFVRTRVHLNSDPSDDVTEEEEERNGPDYDVITLNVGGVLFQTYRKTFTRRPKCRLGNRKFMAKHYDQAMACYFFDRDPDMFKATLNYLRTGDLHLPSYICGPAAKKELEYWGVLPNEIEQCCWINYNEWNSTQEALKRLEKDRKSDDEDIDPIENDRNAPFWARLRPKIWRVLNNTNGGVCAKLLGFFSLTVVVVSIFSFLAETTKPFEYYETSTLSSESLNITNGTQSNETTSSTDQSSVKVKHPVLHLIDIFCVTYFIVEYLVRLVFSPQKFKFIVSLVSVIDVLAILPDLIETAIYFFKPELREDVDAVSYITLLRVIRVLRIFRLVRHSPGLWILIYTMRASFSELMLLVWFMGLGVLVFSSLIYYVEDRKLFPSIPFGFWWALITMTTVGYGDISPANTLGKVVGSLCAMAGVLMIGFTVPALVNNFMLYYRHIQFAMQVEKMEKELNQFNQEVSVPEETLLADDAKSEEFNELKDTSDAMKNASRMDSLYTRMNGKIESVDIKGQPTESNLKDSFSLKMDTAM